MCFKVIVSGLINKLRQGAKVSIMYIMLTKYVYSSVKVQKHRK